MNMVVCSHPGDRFKGIFQTPESVELDAGTLVRVDTVNGSQPAVCITGTFRADPEVICPLWGTQPKKMKRVLSFLLETKLEWPDEPERDDNDDEDEP